MKLRLSMLIILSGLMMKINAQDTAVYYPKIGEPIKDHTFQDLTNYPEKQLKISDYKGKWLVIDVWGRGCSGCIASFPKINTLDKQFKDRAKIMMVGIYDRKTDKSYTKKVFLTRAARYGLQFTNAYDSTFADKYDVAGIPAIFVINPEGILVAKAVALDSTILTELMSGKSPEYIRNYSAHEPLPKTYNYELPILTNGTKSNGGIDTAFIGRSVFARWQKGMPAYYISGFDPKFVGRTVNAVGFDLSELYRIAYTGKPGWDVSDSLYGKTDLRVIFRVSDSSLFQLNYKKQRTGNNTYIYQKISAKSDINGLSARKSLLEDLNGNLGLTSTIEENEVEVMKLIVLDQKKVEKLRTKGGVRKVVNYEDRPGRLLKNVPFKEFVIASRISQALSYANPNGLAPAIVDSTGINYNIDMDFDGDFLDWPQVIDVLQKHGLGVKKGTALMYTIVISEMKEQ